ncbi:MAG: S-layer homology domain-containing protein [Clostridia bacterium]|nr:S-layer homology domain-containing protein [Clostridia bacterium]
MKRIVSIILCVLMLIPATTVYSYAEALPFDDVKEGMWFYPYVEFCKNRGYMNGVSDTEFAPHSELTRAMFVTILAAVDNYDRAAYAGSTGFNDVPENAWFAAPVKWANTNGIVTGRAEGIFDPEAKVTRQEMTLMLYKFAIYKGIDVTNDETLSANPDAANVAEWAMPGMCWAISTKVLIGSVRGMILPKENAERCDVAVVIRSFIERVFEKPIEAE